MDRFDFISSLPDAILLLFLMLLETKEAVRTCVLSKRWERLWISLPFLNITCHSLEGMSHSLSLLTNAERLELCVTCPQLQVCNLFRKIQIQFFFFNSKPLSSKFYLQPFATSKVHTHILCIHNIICYSKNEIRSIELLLRHQLVSASHLWHQCQHVSVHVVI